MCKEFVPATLPIPHTQQELLEALHREKELVWYYFNICKSYRHIVETLLADGTPVAQALARKNAQKVLDDTKDLFKEGS